VILDFLVDNSRSGRDIKEIRCSLTYFIAIKKAEEVLQTFSVDMHLLELKGVQRNKRQEQRQEFVFDLGQIIGEYQVEQSRKRQVQSKITSEKARQKGLSHQASLWDSGNNKKMIQQIQQQQMQNQVNPNDSSLMAIGRG
jgi:myosin heavy subunit